MTREQKKAKRKKRALARWQRRKDEAAKIRKVMYEKDIPWPAARSFVRRGFLISWKDSNSPTGYSQLCSWQGHCQSPCNGDC